MSTVFRTVLSVAILVIVFSCDSIFRPRLDIDIDDVPVYPNAQNLIREDPESENALPLVYAWNFVTNDTPDAVWQFYVDEMGEKWSFHDTSSPQSESRSLIVNSCHFHYLLMTDSKIDDDTYSVRIEFIKEPCR